MFEIPPVLRRLMLTYTQEEVASDSLDDEGIEEGEY
jgi:hypothetical protein